MRLVLASASPRRSELLRSAGFEFEVLPAHVEETPQDGETVDAYTRRVALDKAHHAWARIADPAVTVIAADTEVFADGRILGKPVDDAHAKDMLRSLAGSVHDVLTAVVVCAHKQEFIEVVTTRVGFVRMSHEEIDWYVGTGEPRGKAGAYAIQGHGARFIDRIEGSWSNVVGLPIHTVHRLLAQVAPR